MRESEELSEDQKRMRLCHKLAMDNHHFIEEARRVGRRVDSLLVVTIIILLIEVCRLLG